VIFEHPRIVLAALVAIAVAVALLLICTAQPDTDQTPPPSRDTPAGYQRGPLWREADSLALSPGVEVSPNYRPSTEKNGDNPDA
jgi:hypothetical protein